MIPALTAPPPAPDLPDLCHSLIERSPVPMAELEGVGHVMRYVNPAFCHLVGKAGAALIGTPFADTVQEGDGCLALLERVYRTGKAETHAESAPPEPHPAYWSYAMWPVLDAEQRPVGVMVQVTETTQFHQQTVAMNEALLRSSVRQHELTEAAEKLNEQLQAEITERKQVEAALVESEQRWHTLAETMPTLVWMARPDGFLDYYNQRWYDYTGMTAEQLVGQGWQAALHPDDRAKVTACWEEARQIGQPYEHEARWRRAADASYRWHLIRGTPLRAPDGQVLRWIGVCTDIEEQKRTEAELQRINDELQQFVYVASHDLNEPLRMVSNFVQLLAKRYQGKLDTKADEFIGFAVEGVQRMQELLKDLLAYTRVGGSLQAFTAVDCEAVLTRVLGDLHLTITDTTATVTHDPLPTVHGDAVQLGLVFQNLIGSALKFRSEQPPRIHVTARQEGKQWVFAVRDQGIGLDPHQAERIFQVFQRLHTHKQYPGTGIGLAVCKKIVERHGGRIWVESTPGQGATFFFTLV